MSVIYLDPKQVPFYYRGDYKGKHFKLIITETISIPLDAGLWSGGSREVYSFIELSTGRTVQSPAQNSSPWNQARQEFNSPLPVGIAMVIHSIYCGKDLGLTFYVRPESVTPLLADAKPHDLSENERTVLNATASYKSSYMGRDRYQMCGTTMSRAEWEAAKQSLIQSGHLNKAGAITVKGRNARNS